ncbi:hypothetical protein IFM89_009988, partial [Coptis chinensis]
NQNYSIFSIFLTWLPCSTNLSTTKTSPSLRYKKLSRLSLVRGTFRAQASNISIGYGGFDGREENDNQKGTLPAKDISKPEKPLIQVPYFVSIVIVLLGCALAFSLIAFAKGSPSSILKAIAKLGFTAAFTLIFVSEIGDKTFFIAALLPT